ncbi:VOC family protein [Pradoshia sp.]
MTEPLFKGMEGVFIPVKNPVKSMKWYENILGFKQVYYEENAAVMKISEGSETVVCLVKMNDHQPMHFPDNSFGVGKYYNFIPSSPIEDVYAHLQAMNVEVGRLDGEGDTRFFTFYDPDGNPLGVCQ